MFSELNPQYTTRHFRPTLSTDIVGSQNDGRQCRSKVTGRVLQA